MKSNVPFLSSLNPFLRGYLVAAYWTNDDDAPSGEYSSSGRPEYFHSKLSAEAFQEASNDCAAFEHENFELIKGNLSEAGHCFWLSRCGHGSGFFDSNYFGSDENREILQNKARKYGNVDFYLGDDGVAYFC